MTAPKKADDQYSDAEATKRMEAALRRALNTPHKPHAPIGKKPKRDSTKAGKATGRKK